MTQEARIVVFQTAFPGDVVLTLPLAQALRRNLPGAFVGFVATPGGATLLKNHPAVSTVLVYDKRGADRGAAGMRRVARRLREGHFGVALVPHRSIRSALVVRLARIPRRVGFSTSAGKMFLSDVVPYDREAREIDRNMSLLRPLGFLNEEASLPSLYPAGSDMATVDALVRSWQAHGGLSRRWVTLAPGSVWATKRWPAAHFVGLARMLVDAGWALALIGGAEDRSLCDQIVAAVGGKHALNAAGTLSLLQSAEFIRRSDALVSNDSAPMHLACAVRVPVVALFGPTVPGFGFAPLGPRDIVVERRGLSCRPCSIHGGTKCPIGTFECMIAVSPGEVFRAIESLLLPSTVR
jgi:heptosyltransferase-2